MSDWTNALALTPRRYQVAKLIAQGLENKDICTLLKIKRQTLDCTVRSIYRVLGVHGIGNPRVLAARIVWEHERVLDMPIMDLRKTA
jgi:DNA-binding NarL/FixJ family response regulator